MPQDILSAATEQAEQSDPPVKVAALLCAARVLTAFDQAEAARVLERGIALATALSELDRSTILKGRRIFRCNGFLLNAPCASHLPSVA